jgi:NADH dehydrogenase/NADH:ubiquinone oxidoreductase subunit G
VKVQSINNDPVNGAVICAEGRFSYQLMSQGAVDSDLDKAAEALKSAANMAVVVSPRLTVEQAYVSAQLAKGLGAELNYLSDTASEATGNTKITGEANIALLTRLGATPLNGSSYDCVISVGSGISRTQTGNANIIAITTPGTAMDADHLLPMADPISIDGAFLNREGDLAILNGSIQDPEDQAGLSSLANLAGNSELADLSKVRSALVDEVPELKALTSLNGDRLINTDLAPALSGTAPDAREIAFSKHMESIGLSS